MSLYRATLPDVFSWESQVSQYPMRYRPGPGIAYFPGDVSQFAGMEDMPPVDCLLYYDEQGWLRGILNHYPVDYPPHEQAGNVNVFVDPARRRRGIGTALVTEAFRRWGVVLAEQRFTVAGAALADHLHRVHGLR